MPFSSSPTTMHTQCPLDSTIKDPSEGDSLRVAQPGRLTVVTVVCWQLVPQAKDVRATTVRAKAGQEVGEEAGGCTWAQTAQAQVAVAAVRSVLACHTGEWGHHT